MGGPSGLDLHGPFRAWLATVTSTAVGPTRDVFVVDFYHHRVQKFALGRHLPHEFRDRGKEAGEGELECPMGLAVAADGTVLVADFGNNRVQAWRQAR